MDITPRISLTRVAAAILAAGVVALASLGVGQAHAGSWESGTYTGKLHAKGSDRPKTKIKLKITQKKIKLVSAEFVLDCDGDRGRINATVHGGKGRLLEGPAGAGFSIAENERRRGAGYSQNYDFVGGVEGDVVRGSASMQRIYNRPYESCIDDIMLDFKAKKR